MRIRWSNRLETVDAFLRAGNLPKAKQVSLDILQKEGIDVMLSDDEVEYLRLVSKLDKIIDTGRVSLDDLRNTD